MDPIPLEDLALLEVLQRIDQAAPLTSGDTEIRQRLVDSGLVDDGEEPPHLTSAGIELCKSLQHRVAADTQAARIVEARDAEEATNHGNGATSPPESRADLAACDDARLE
jgi:hypothetical protein